MKTAAGIDLSLTATGFAFLGGEEGPQIRTITSKPRGSTWFDRRVRLSLLRLEIVEAVFAADPDLVVMEGPSYGNASNGGAFFDRSGLWWMTYSSISGLYPIAVVSPKARAKYATGKGNAGKDAVMVSTLKRYPDLPIEDNNQADSVLLAAMGLRYLGSPLEPDLPKMNLTALDNAAWPDKEAS